MKKIFTSLVVAAGLTSFAGSAKAAILNLSGAAGEGLSGALPFSTPSQTDSRSIVIAFDGTSFKFGRYAVSVNSDWIITTPDSMDGFRVDANPSYTITSSPIVFGVTIDSTLGFTNNIFISESFSNAYYGLAYQAGGNFNYGWLKLSYDADGYDATLVAGGMNTTLNESILAGQTAVTAVPEPRMWMPSLVLVLGVAFRRRRSRSKATVV
jgi:hypothetical protein